MSDATRAWTARYQAAYNGRYPNMIHAASYAATLHYLKAIEAARTDKAAKVIAKMKEMPVEDRLHEKGSIRADGRVVRPAYLYEVKKPSESKYPGDYYKLRATVPAKDAYRPEAEGGCPLVKANG
jgi:branched-chain amino acid transport system substrate-binding protein